MRRVVDAELLRQSRTYALRFQKKVADSVESHAKKVADSTESRWKKVAEDSGIPLSGFRDSVQDSGIPGFQDSGIPGFQDSGIPGFQKKRPFYSKYSTETRAKKF